jgi:hypothetical protein
MRRSFCCLSLRESSSLRRVRETHHNLQQMVRFTHPTTPAKQINSYTVCTRTTTKYATSTTAITYINHFTSRPWPESSFTSG